MSLVAAPLVEIPQLASLIVFLVTLLLPPVLSCREMALLLVLTSWLVCAVTPVAEFRLIAFCVSVMVLEVAFILGPAFWNMSPPLAWTIVFEAMAPLILGPKIMPPPLME